MAYSSFSKPVFVEGRLVSFEEIIARAEAIRAEAEQIAAGGIKEARQYVQNWRDFFHKNPSEHYPDAVRAVDVLRCAQAIVKRGVAYWVHEHASGDKMLITVSLSADASAGPVGYDPLVQVKTDDAGTITHYASGNDLNGPIWTPLSNTLIRDVGEALFGPQWQTPLAAALGMSDRHVRRLASGAYTLTATMVADLLDTCETRRSAISDVISRLKAFGA